MTRLLSTIFLTAISLSASPQTEGDAGIWYMDGAVYVATFDANNKSIKMDGGTMDEARSFTLKVQNPDDPFYYDVAGASTKWLKASQAYPDVEDGHGYYIFTDKMGNAQSIMYNILSIELLEDIVKEELASIVEGEYKDIAGRKTYITEGSLQLPGEESYSMDFCKKGNTPINVLISNGKYWQFTGTYDGLILQQVYPTDGDYMPVTDTEPILLTRQNGTMGRWPLTSMAAVQHSMLQYLDKKALHYMSREIYARLGGYYDEDPKVEEYFKHQPWFTTTPDRTHLTKLELRNYEVIKAEESTR